MLQEELGHSLFLSHVFAHFTFNVHTVLHIVSVGVNIEIAETTRNICI